LNIMARSLRIFKVYLKVELKFLNFQPKYKRKVSLCFEQTFWGELDGIQNSKS